MTGNKRATQGLLLLLTGLLLAAPISGCASAENENSDEKDRELAEVLEKLENLKEQVDLLEGKHEEIDRKIEDVEKKIAKTRE